MTARCVPGTAIDGARMIYGGFVPVAALGDR